MVEFPVRKNNRLANYDYSNKGCYFITICIKENRCILWNNHVGAASGRPPVQYAPMLPSLLLSKTGNTIYAEINRFNGIYPNVTIDKYVIIPNHIHMIIRLIELPPESKNPQVAPEISRIINKFKGSVTKQLGQSIWQKSYHDHIIRNEDDYWRIFQYIDENPMKWQEDRYYCYNISEKLS